jgi:hypothetical protein
MAVLGGGGGNERGASVVRHTMKVGWRKSSGEKGVHCRLSATLTLAASGHRVPLPARTVESQDVVQRRCRVKREQLKRFQGLLPESQGLNVTLTVLYPVTEEPARPTVGLAREEPIFLKWCVCAYVLP